MKLNVAAPAGVIVPSGITRCLLIVTCAGAASVPLAVGVAADTFNGFVVSNKPVATTSEANVLKIFLPFILLSFPKLYGF